MEKIKVTSADTSFFEDGLWIVQANDAEGREYTLGDAKYPIRPMPFETALRVAERVCEAGEINPDLWSVRIPYGTDAWLIDGMEYRQIEDEKMGFA